MTSNSPRFIVAASGWAVSLAALLLACSCRPVASTRRAEPAAQSSDAPIRVVVSIPPQKYFVERVGGEHVAVSVLVAPGQSHHTYEPTSKQLVDLTRARVFFRIGVPFEKQVVAKVGQTLQDLRIVDTSEGIQLRAMNEAESHVSGPGDHADDHRHDELDPHIWMNPRLVKLQARIICRELARLAPAHGQTFEQNRRVFEADLDEVDASIARALAPLKGRAFYVFHPAFGYFADAYGLRQVAVETGGKQPTARQLAALIEQAKRDGVKLIFVQPQFASKGAEAVAEAIGGAVVAMDPLAEDYLGNLLDVAAKIQKALTSAGSMPSTPSGQADPPTGEPPG